ncbi:MAG TPA: hypothetical protein VMG60_24690 [Burkholderiaceae bacterium]|nr:hypothetical protein [Burkholderiaceae bacterium]
MILSMAGAPAVSAEDKILFAKVPPGIETPLPLPFACEALECREWTIVGQGAEFDRVSSRPTSARGHPGGTQGRRIDLFSSPLCARPAARV